MGLLSLFLAVALAAALSSCLTFVLRPILMHYALAKPNSRSSHTVPTPQGAGIAVIAATLIVAGGAIALSEEISKEIVAIFAATIFIATVGITDDIKAVPVLPRLITHAIAVGGILLATPHDLRIAPICPLWIERALLLISGVWFVNVTNFMDGLDWMTVAEIVPVAGTLAVFGIFGYLPPTAALLMAALGGAVIGFAPFNRPVAKIFLGDVGSLPIGLLLGWALFELAAQSHVAAALLLPLFYLSDATVTLIRRTFNGEHIWVAHRTHFYQRAIDNGFAVIQVIKIVFGLNLILAALAAATIIWTGLVTQLTLLTLGFVGVVAILIQFNHSQKIPGFSRQDIN